MEFLGWGLRFLQNLGPMPRDSHVQSAHAVGPSEFSTYPAGDTEPLRSASPAPQGDLYYPIPQAKTLRRKCFGAEAEPLC